MRFASTAKESNLTRWSHCRVDTSTTSIDKYVFAHLLAIGYPLVFKCFQHFYKMANAYWHSAKLASVARHKPTQTRSTDFEILTLAHQLNFEIKLNCVALRSVLFCRCSSYMGCCYFRCLRMETASFSFLPIPNEKTIMKKTSFCIIITSACCLPTKLPLLLFRPLILASIHLSCHLKSLMASF